MENICENLKKIKQELEILNPNVKLIAVSKNFSYLAVKKAYECSQKIFGENRVQEAIEKIELAKADNLDIQWHLIGNLQLNKAKKAVSYFDYKNEVLDAAKNIVNFENLKLYGLMCIVPQAQESEIRKAFRDMKSIFEDLKKSICPTLSELSMGMSDDFRIAIQEGSTIIRIGRGIFGERT